MGWLGRFGPDLIAVLLRELRDNREEKRAQKVEQERMDPRVVFYDYAMSHVGLPYRWGGDDPIAGYDCSGFVIELLQSVGVLPTSYDTTADGLWHHFDSFRASEAKFGALVFYGLPEKVTHVGFCLNESQVLEAGGGGSRTLSEADAASQNAYIRVRPVGNRKDLVGYVHPNYPWEGEKCQQVS